VFPAVALAHLSGAVPPPPAAELWDGHEAYAAYDDEIEPAPLRVVVTDALGIAPDACGLVDHQAIGDAWERARGKFAIIPALLDDLGHRT
jgi:hypothetical protein